MGGGVELGLPTRDHFTVGLFVDVRAAVRLPFELEPMYVGIAWSSGIALLWI